MIDPVWLKVHKTLPAGLNEAGFRPSTASRVLLPCFLNKGFLEVEDVFLAITCLSPLVLFLRKCWERSLGHLSQLQPSWPSNQLYHSSPCIRYFSARVIKRRSQSGKNVKFSMENMESLNLWLPFEFIVSLYHLKTHNWMVDKCSCTLDCRPT